MAINSLRVIEARLSVAVSLLKLKTDDTTAVCAARRSANKALYSSGLSEKCLLLDLVSVIM
jgi:hypothetical protein